MSNGKSEEGTENLVLPESYTGPSDFCHLHNHTVFSTLDGVATPEQYATQCAERGYSAMSATEHGNMASVPDMYFAFKKVGVKYIVGCEIYYNDFEPTRKVFAAKNIKLKDVAALNEDLSVRIRRNRHLTVLVKNKKGFENLMKLTTLAHEFGFYFKPRIWFDKLCEYKEGLIVLSGCLNGPVAHELREDSVQLNDHGIVYERSLKMILDGPSYVRKFKEAFGEDYYIELQMPGLPEIYDHEVFQKLAQLAYDFKIKPVITNDCHYLTRSEFQIQKVMMAISQDLTVDDPKLFHVNSDEQFMKTRGELWAMFKNHQYSDGVPDSFFEEACDNSLHIAETCDPFVPDTSPKILDWETIGKVDASEELRRRTNDSLKELGLHTCKRKFVIDSKEVTYAEQAQIELDRFISKGFASYFLIMQDLVKYGKDRGWPFGPRGSAGGSLVCYLLGIHNIDSLRWGLSFDRFLSPARGGFGLKVRMEA